MTSPVRIGWVRLGRLGGIGWARLGRFGSDVLWYLRELTGETDYQRYVDHCTVYGCGTPPVSREQFERRRWEDRAASPGTRCC